MRLLGLDTGARRTGVASFDTVVGFALPLPTIIHANQAELLTSLESLVRMRKIDRVIIGLPRLPNGEEAEQAEWARGVGSALELKGIVVTFIDERFTTPRQIKAKDRRRRNDLAPINSYDGDAAAACAILGSISPQQLKEWGQE